MFWPAGSLKLPVLLSSVVYVVTAYRLLVLIISNPAKPEAESGALFRQPQLVFLIFHINIYVKTVDID
jgi:hypothetical protein